MDIWKKKAGRWQIVEGHLKLFPPPLKLTPRRPGDGSSVMSVPVEISSGGIHVGTPRTLFRLPATVVQIAATADLQRFLASVKRGGAETASIQVVLNWPSEFEKH